MPTKRTPLRAGAPPCSAPAVTALPLSAGGAVFVPPRCRAALTNHAGAELLRPRLYVFAAGDHDGTTRVAVVSVGVADAAAASADDAEAPRQAVSSSTTVASSTAASAATFLRRGERKQETRTRVSCCPGACGNMRVINMRNRGEGGRQTGALALAVHSLSCGTGTPRRRSRAHSARPRRVAQAERSSCASRRDFRRSARARAPRWTPLLPPHPRPPRAFERHHLHRPRLPEEEREASRRRRVHMSEHRKRRNRTEKMIW